MFGRRNGKQKSRESSTRILNNDCRHSILYFKSSHSIKLMSSSSKRFILQVKRFTCKLWSETWLLRKRSLVSFCGIIRDRHDRGWWWESIHTRLLVQSSIGMVERLVCHSPRKSMSALVCGMLTKGRGRKRKTTHRPFTPLAPSDRCWRCIAQIGAKKPVTIGN